MKKPMTIFQIPDHIQIKINQYIFFEYADNLSKWDEVTYKGWIYSTFFLNKVEDFISKNKDLNLDFYQIDGNGEKMTLEQQMDQDENEEIIFIFKIEEFEFNSKDFIDAMVGSNGWRQW